MHNGKRYLPLGIMRGGRGPESAERDEGEKEKIDLGIDFLNREKTAGGRGKEEGRDKGKEQRAKTSA